MNEEMKTSPIIRGCWQLAAGHSQETRGIEPILDALESGFDTFDCADIYLGVEELLGKASVVAQSKLRIHTKFVPDLKCLQTIDRQYIEKIIDRSLKRLQVECIDLVQFHWWNYDIKNYLPTMEILSDLKITGKISEIGLTNVNSTYLEEFSEHSEVASLQTQVSLFDSRVERGLSELCRKKGIKIFAYGSLLGGFISEKWLNKDEPQLEQLANRSLVKYKLLIDSACGWAEFQRRLSILSSLARKYRCGIANIAIATLLQTNKADAVIVGLSPRNFATHNQNLAKLPLLESRDLQELSAWTCNLPGDAYDAERDENGAHAKVMKYDLNAR